MTSTLIICSKTNEEICNNLLEIAKNCLMQNRINYKIIRVPGAFEIPIGLTFCMSNEFSGYVVLGCIIKSSTPHFDYVCSESCRGISTFAIQNKVALGFGVITANNKEEAIFRSDKQNPDNYAKKAVEACMEMMTLRKTFLSNA